MFVSSPLRPIRTPGKQKKTFEVIAGALNTCAGAVKTLVTDMAMLSQAAVDIKLATRADATKHNGNFRVIVEGVNTTLDAVIEPVNEAVATTHILTV
jgi:methyl-accepting chemotaxis protein